jgi:ABC-type Mn2+/Zn2+ transport system permease subunit
MGDLLHYAFMQRALIAGVIVGTTCAIIGTYVVLRGMAFMGAGIAHSSLGGIALGLVLNFNPILAAVAFCLFVAWVIGTVSQRGGVREETAVGIFFTASMAFGILLVGVFKGSSYTTDLTAYLFGSIISVTNTDLWLSGIMACVVLLAVLLLFKELLFITFDPEMAQVAGVPARKLQLLLLGLVALTVVLSLKVVGVVLVSALIVTPAATAYQLTEEFRKMMAISVAVGLVASIGGLLLSYWLNTGSGSTIVLLATAIFLVAVVFSPRRRKGRLTQEAKQSEPA